MGILSRFGEMHFRRISMPHGQGGRPGQDGRPVLQAHRGPGPGQAETAGVMAEESRTKRLVEENEKRWPKKLNWPRGPCWPATKTTPGVFGQEAGNRGSRGQPADCVRRCPRERSQDAPAARQTGAGHQRPEPAPAGHQGQVAVARTQERINKLGDVAEKTRGSISAFERMEGKKPTACWMWPTPWRSWTASPSMRPRLWKKIQAGRRQRFGGRRVGGPQETAGGWTNKNKRTLVREPGVLCCG